MKKLLLSLVIIFSINGILSAAKNIDTLFYASGTKHLLFYSIPDNYDPAKKYPLVVGLHYCGGTAKSYRNSLSTIVDILDLIVVCPDNSSNQIPSTKLDIVTAAADSAKSAYNIDADSMYLTGMSCNAEFTLRQGLNKFYPFRGIFPWVPYVTDKNFTPYNLKSDIPVALAVGTNDGNFGILMTLFDSLKANSSDKNLVLVPGVGHEQLFSEFGNTMIKCLRYINTPKTITVGSVPDITMKNTDAAREVEADVNTSGTKELQFNVIISNSAKLKPSEISYTPENHKVKFNLVPVTGKYGTVKAVVEVSEKDGPAIAQSVFNVQLDKDETSVKTSEMGHQIKISPNPANGYINICSNRTIDEYEIIDLTGRLVLYGKASSNNLTVDISDLSKGVYFIKTTTENIIDTERFCVI